MVKMMGLVLDVCKAGRPTQDRAVWGSALMGVMAAPRRRTVALRVTTELLAGPINSTAKTADR